MQFLRRKSKTIIIIYYTFTAIYRHPHNTHATTDLFCSNGLSMINTILNISVT